MTHSWECPGYEAPEIRRHWNLFRLLFTVVYGVRYLKCVPLSRGRLGALVCPQVSWSADSSWNLLLTSSWGMVVPRAAEAYEGLAVNALGFTGSFFVKSEEALEKLKAIGPTKLWANVARPRL